jgi:hypothetical protein
MIEAAEFDNKFDRGEDIAEFLDFSQAERPGHDPKRVTVDFPTWRAQGLLPQGQNEVRCLTIRGINACSMKACEYPNTGFGMLKISK